MQEMLEWVRATLPMDLETPQMIERKIESLLQKEKEVMCEFADEFSRECIDFHHAKTMSPEKFFELRYGGNK